MDVVFRLCGQWWYKMAEQTGSSNDLYHFDIFYNNTAFPVSGQGVMLMEDVRV